MPRHQDCEFIARPAFSNISNNNTEPNDHEKPILVINEQSVDDKNNDAIIPNSDETEHSSINKSTIAAEEIVSDTEQILDETVASVPLTDNESSIGSPLMENRRLSESTSVDQISAGSPVCLESPLVSAEESPVVAKRSINDTVVEPLTGTVFRKVTLKKRRVDTRNLPPGENFLVYHR